ncbi:MAG: zinc-binding dehydrogenase [Deltaproteobacteria bacterium]|nr:zinc-binding dehydrogenase [Deltaproteobacteria bacterium]
MGKKGRAAVMHKANTPLEIREYPLIEVERGHILVKIKCCTICGSDLHSWLGKRGTVTPIILGHEIVGEIVEMGEGVTHDSGDRPLKVGDRITWTIMDNCGKCYYCREKGLTMKCIHLKKYGHDSCASPPHFNGGFAEFCYITPGTCVIKIPENLSNEEAAPANCALATVMAGWEAAGLRPFENVLIQGGGALGIYAAALARHNGCHKIIVTDILEHRLEFVKGFGATDTINTKNLRDEEIVQAIVDLTGGFGVDAVLEVAGMPSLIPLGLKCLRKGGRLIVQGTAFSGAHFTYDASDIVFRWLTIRGVHNYDTRHLQWGINFLEQTRNIFPFHKIVTHNFPLHEINQAMQMAHSGEGIRIAVKPQKS